MKSSDEEYLDSLLNSAQQSNNKSALSRMSSKNTSVPGALGGAGDIGDLVINSNGNQDLSEIGKVLDQLDKNVLVDQQMADLLDDIETPISSSIPKVTIGNNPSALDVRDPEEIALDEAIADAERMDAEIQSGKFDGADLQSANSAPVEETPAPAPSTVSPLVDIEEGDDALLEMAPEVSLPEDNEIITGTGDQVASDTPEEIFTDLLDDMKDGNLASSTGDDGQENLSDVLDNIKEDDGDIQLDDLEKAMDMAMAADAASEAKEAMAADISAEGLIPDTPEAMAEADVAAGDMGLDDISLSDPDPDNLMGDTGAADAAAAEPSLDELSMDGLNVEDALEEAGDLAGAEPSADSPDERNLEDLMPEGMSEEDLSGGDASSGGDAPAADISLENMSEDDFNLDALEASLDTLIGSEGGDDAATEGEVAAIDTSPEEAPAGGSDLGAASEGMEDLDVLMSSLANDEIEDLENTAAKDAEAGQPQEGGLSEEDMLGALTEDEFNMDDPSLEELASIPERGKGGYSGGGGGQGAAGDDDASGGKKKNKKEGFFARLFKALTREDDESSTEGLASLTDENQQVLNELGEDGGKKGKKKKEKKEKKAKEKKPKKEKPPKEKKPPKPKKEKKPKPPKDPGVPEKAISPKKVSLAFFFAASLGILVTIPAFVLPDQIASNRANTAYHNREFTTAYKMLYGKTMNEDETLIYEQSRVQAWAQRYLDGYENYTAMNMKEEALDMLLMAKRNKASLLEEAAKYSVENDVKLVYDSIESLLSESYGLSEEDVIEINSIKKDRDYTIRLMEIVGTIES